MTELAITGDIATACSTLLNRSSYTDKCSLTRLAVIGVRSSTQSTRWVTSEARVSSRTETRVLSIGIRIVATRTRTVYFKTPNLENKIKRRIIKL